MFYDVATLSGAGSTGPGLVQLTSNTCSCSEKQGACGAASASTAGCCQAAGDSMGACTSDMSRKDGGGSPSLVMSMPAGNQLLPNFQPVPSAWEACHPLMDMFDTPAASREPMLPCPPLKPSRAPLHQGPATLDLAIPWLLDKQNTLQEGQFIGSGGFGRVHRGVWQGDIAVAIKYFDIHGPLQLAVNEFMAELAIMKDLEHPQIVQGNACFQGNVCFQGMGMSACFASDAIGTYAQCIVTRLLTTSRDADIVQFHGAVIEKDRLAIVMDFVPCGSLYNLLHNEVRSVCAVSGILDPPPPRGLDFAG
eukprot:360719-Chlamydomonas_euryale.AAC.4